MYPTQGRSLALWIIFAALTACSGGSGSGSSTSQSVTGSTATECDPNDPNEQATQEFCGSVLIGMTDADGDFLSYSVDIASLTLNKANGTTVHTLPVSARIDFAQYVDLTEFLTAATVPPGVYTSGTMTLDYSNAEVFVESNGDAVIATVTDGDGMPLSDATVDIVFDDGRPLVVKAGLPSLMTIDFDLDASHTVDISVSPAIAQAKPFIVADIEPVDSKQLRIRGPLLRVDPENNLYRIAIRPFHLRDGHFGQFDVHTNDHTQFEIDGVPYVGEAGLNALAKKEAGTATVAFGTLTPSDRIFIAEEVLAGSSVPGADYDVVRGNVIARSGNELTVRGATLIRSGGAVVFNDYVTVLIGNETGVTKAADSNKDLDIDDISIGQRIRAFGLVVSDTLDPLVIDADPGRVRLLVTHLSGTVNTVHEGQLDMDLISIDRRRIALFDFSGTGMTADLDADPDNYEVATGALPIDQFALDRPVRAYGFVTPFGMAPPDFEGRTFIDLSDHRAHLVIGWMGHGSTTAFSAINENGLVVNLDDPEIGERHHIVIADVPIDLFELPASPLIAPNDGRGLYAIAKDRSVRIYHDFAIFSDALATLLDGSNTVKALHARGAYDADANIVTAHRLAVIID